jgi:ADP-heptose:LPS heptosyltransferase
MNGADARQRRREQMVRRGWGHRVRESLRYLPYLGRPGTVVLRRCSRGLGDNLMLSLLAREIKRVYPSRRVVVETEYPDLFRNNPNVDLVLCGKVAPFYVKPKYVLDRTTRTHILDQLVAALGLPLEGWEKRLDLFLEERRFRDVEAELPADFIVICSQGKGTFAANRKEWGVDRFQELIDSMPGETFVQIGLGSDVALRGAVDLRGRDVLTSAFALKRARTAVFTEGGWGHVASAVGARAVVLLGGIIDPAAIAYPTNLTVVCQPGCGPCFTSGEAMEACPTMECMKRISPAFVRQLLVEKRYLHGGVVDVPAG